MVTALTSSFCIMREKSYGTFLLTSFFQVSFMSIYANIRSYNKFHSIDRAFKIFHQLVVQSSVIGGRVFDFLFQLTLFNM